MENQMIEQTYTEQTTPTQAPAPIDEKIRFWEYLVLIVLFAIPIIGFIAALVLLFAPQRKSLKNFAGAALTWISVQAVAGLIAIIFAITAIGGILVPAINNLLGTEFQGIGDAISVVTDFTSGNYSFIIRQMESEILDAIGEQYAPLLDELATGKYDDLIEDIAFQNYADALEDLREGDYPSLKTVLSEEDYNFFIGELEKAARGEHSEFFSKIQGAATK